MGREEGTSTVLSPSFSFLNSIKLPISSNPKTLSSSKRTTVPGSACHLHRASPTSTVFTIFERKGVQETIPAARVGRAVDYLLEKG
jgi:hypothetical protein